MRYVKFPVLLLVFCFIWQSSPVLAARAHSQAHPRERVYLMRGLLNVFSTGMDTLGYELQQRNIEAVVGNHALSSSYASDAIAACKSGQISSIVLVGHSLGANAVVDMAEELKQAGVRVALVLTVDPVSTAVVPSNVHALKNFYISDGVGHSVRRSSDFRGSLENLDMKADPQAGHLSLDKLVTIHRRMIGYIQAAASSRCR
jgi:hypothetical protein